MVHCWPQKMMNGFKEQDRVHVFYAHTSNDGSEWQFLSTHLRNVARLAKEFAIPFGGKHESEWAGLMDDLGKYRE